ncbi:MAG: tetratricopeptide repeat protein, partial [Phycisphaerales bacterium]|nr:tetratricopeptide repeat protein [Phycisphaerales bacterium]
RAVFEEVRNETAKLREQFPKDTGVRMLAAAAWSHAGSVEEAAAELSGAIAECEPKLPAELQLVDLYQRNGRMDEALAAARRLVENHADVAAPRVQLAEIQRRAGRNDEAQTTLHDATEHLTGVERFEARRALAQNLILVGQRSAAAELLATLASERPSDVEIRASLLSLPEVRSNAAEAARRIGELKVIEGDAGVRWKLEQARRWVESGEWRSRQPEVIELLQACRRDDPGWEPPSLVLAVLHERLGNIRDAEQTLRDAMTKNPLALTAADRLVDLLKRQGRYAEAEQVLDHLPVGSEAFGLQRIDLATARGDYDEAIRRLELHVAAHPEEADALVRLARLVFAARKDRSRAETLLAQAASLASDSLEVLRARVSLLHTAGEAAAALALLDAEVSRLNNLGVYWLRAKYMVETGRFDQAERDYEHLTTFVGQAALGYGLLAEFHESRGRRGDAVAALEAGLKFDPENPALSRALMKVLIASDNAEDRVRGRDRLVQLQDRFPDDPELLRFEAALLLDEHTAAGDARAKELLESVVSLNPSDAAAYQLLINQAREHREFERAASLVSRGLTTNPTNLVLTITRIAVEAEAGRNRVARELAQKVFDDHPSDLGVANQLTDVFRRASDADSAALFSKRALAIAPNDEYANIARAAALAGKGDAKAAMEQLSRFIGTEDGAGSLGAHLALASIAAKQQEFAAAEAALLRADELAPGDAGVGRERMRLLAAQTRFDEVAKALSEIRTNHGDDAVTLVAGGYALAVASDNRWLHEARSAFEAAAQSDPRNLDAYRGLANVAYRTGDIKAAIAAFRSMLNLSPDDAGALNDLAWILMHDKGDAGLVEAEQLAARGAKLYPDDIHLLDTRGVILLHLRRYDDARRDLEKCRSLTEAHPGTRAAASLHLAQVLMAQGGDATAVRQLVEEARKIDQERRVLSDEDRAVLAKLTE